MKGKWLTGVLVLAMAAVTLAGCGAKDATKEKVEQVTLNEVAHSIFYAPQYVAIEEGYFADEGIDLMLITGFGAGWKRAPLAPCASPSAFRRTVILLLSGA